MISYDDTDGDGKLNVNEFYMAFSKLYSEYSCLKPLDSIPLYAQVLFLFSEALVQGFANIPGRVSITLDVIPNLTRDNYYSSCETGTGVE